MTEEGAEEGYYGLPMLKRPTWGWQIAWYFYLEGVSSGALLTASLAELFGGKRMKPAVRAARRVAFLSFLPCPPLLIDDLGDPSRFHHMLRVFKPSSPMNLGAWALTAYSLPLTLLAAKQAASDLPLPRRPREIIGKLALSRSLDVIGIPLALTMMSYPGVLLSTTSTPLWAKSRLLGALFASSAFSAGVAATRLALGLGAGRESEAMRRLGKIENAARIGEAAALAGYLVTTGRAAKPLTTGRHGWRFWAGAVGAGLIAPALIRAFKPKGRRTGLGATLLGSALTLVGSLALKWAVVHAGRDSADDLRGAQEMTRSSRKAPGWTQHSRANEKITLSDLPILLSKNSSIPAPWTSSSERDAGEPLTGAQKAVLDVDV
jgi:formate-dependent nitrite reductase membrane component NrfD